MLVITHVGAECSQISSVLHEASLLCYYLIYLALALSEEVDSQLKVRIKGWPHQIPAEVYFGDVLYSGLHHSQLSDVHSKHGQQTICYVFGLTNYYLILTGLSRMDSSLALPSPDSLRLCLLLSSSDSTLLSHTRLEPADPRGCGSHETPVVRAHRSHQC